MVSLGLHTPPDVGVSSLDRVAGGSQPGCVLAEAWQGFAAVDVQPGQGLANSKRPQSIMLQYLDSLGGQVQYVHQRLLGCTSIDVDKTKRTRHEIGHAIASGPIRACR